MWKAYEARQDNYWNYWISGLDLPIQNEQQDQGGQVRRGNVGFLLEAEEDGDHNQAGDDVVALPPQSNEKNSNFFSSVIRNFETQEHMEKKHVSSSVVAKAQELQSECCPPDSQRWVSSAQLPQVELSFTCTAFICQSHLHRQVEPFAKSPQRKGFGPLMFGLSYRAASIRVTISMEAERTHCNTEVR